MEIYWSKHLEKYSKTILSNLEKGVLLTQKVSCHGIGQHLKHNSYIWYKRYL